MRICRKCKKEKNDSEFGILKSSKDGINPRCKQCCCESVKRSNKSPEAIANKKLYCAEWQKKNREKRLQQSRNWYARNLEKAREMSLESTKRYLQTDKGKQKARERSKNWDKDNIVKRRVHDKTMYAVKTKKINRPNNCSKCFKSCTPHAHHEDYEKPYEVIWLCAFCHFKLHHKHKHYRERTSEKTPYGDAMFRPLEETKGLTQK
jgi:hypothetical protein